MVLSYRSSLVLPPLQCVHFHVGMLLLALRRVRIVGGGGGGTESVTRLVQKFLCSFGRKRFNVSTSNERLVTDM